MIDTVYQILLTVLNKEQRGNVSPTEFNVLSKQVQDEIFRGYFEDMNRDKTKQNKGYSSQGYSNLPLVQRQRIDQFQSKATLTYSSPDFLLPADLYLIKDRGIDYNGTVVDEVESQNASFFSKSLAAPSVTFPTYERNASSITILPTTIISGVTCRYLRTPADPKWTYTLVGGNPLFNAAAGDYQDFELHSSEFSNIVIRLLSYFGINIRDTEVAQYAEALKRITQAREEE